MHPASARATRWASLQNECTGQGACLQTDAVLRRVNALFTHRHCVSWLINIACICSLSDVQPSEINMVYAATNSSAVLKSRSLMAPAAVTRYAIHSAIICACEKRKVIGFTCRCAIAKMAPARVSALPTRSWKATSQHPRADIVPLACAHARMYVGHSRTVHALAPLS